MKLFRSSLETKSNVFLIIAIFFILVELAKEKKIDMSEVNFSYFILIVSKLIVFKILEAPTQKVIFRLIDRFWIELSEFKLFWFKVFYSIVDVVP